MLDYYIFRRRSYAASPCAGADGSADCRGGDSHLTRALSTSGSGHPSGMLASGQYSLDQSVNKSPSHFRDREREREGWTNSEVRNTNEDVMCFYSNEARGCRRVSLPPLWYETDIYESAWGKEIERCH